VTDWVSLRGQVFEAFTPGKEINELRMFSGRKDVIQRLQDIVKERGRNAIIFGERGVGKTSLAAIFHKDLNIVEQQTASSDGSVVGIRVNRKTVVDIHITCDTRDSFDSLWRKVFRRIERPNSTLTADLDYTGPIEPDHVFLEMQKFSQTDLPIIIIDEYDRVEDEECRILITDVIKGLTLSKTNPTIVLVGVAENIMQLIHDHKSIASRNLVQIPMHRMSKEEIKEIITTRLRRLKMKMADDALWRIAHFSAGLPFYAHSLGKFSALIAIAAEKMEISESTVISALDDCIADVDYSIKEGYTKATVKIYRNENIFRHVLAACALAELNDLGQFKAISVEGPLSAILKKPSKVSSFAFHLNELCRPERGSVLRKTGERRTFQFNFAEAAMQPYVVMKSFKEGIITREVFDAFYVRRQRRLSI